MSKGLFITLEGGDGAGKSTQMDNIEKYFTERGYECVRTREPGGTAIGEALREILLNPENKEMTAVTEMLIYAASRAQHVRELVRPAIESGKIVICDRFVDSSLAYQQYGRGLGDMVWAVNQYAVDGMMPDITFWMDVDPETGKARASKAGALDRLELEQMDFHERVYDGYKKLQQTHPDRIKRIDATQDIETIRDDIYAELDCLCAAMKL